MLSKTERTVATPQKSRNRHDSTHTRAAGSCAVFASSGTDGARFEQMDTGDLIIIIYMGQPSKEERKIVRKAKIVPRYIIDESKSMMMALIRFESSPIIYELVFDPTRYKKPRKVNIGNAYKVSAGGVHPIMSERLGFKI
jgi:hypothetical protein